MGVRAQRGRRMRLTRRWGRARPSSVTTPLRLYLFTRMHCPFRGVPHGDHESMNRRALVGLLGVAVLAVAACGSSSTATSSGGTSKAGPPLIAEPTTGVTFSDDFNPYDGNSVAAQMGTRSMVNEPLIEYDVLDPTSSGTHYWLASAYSFNSTGTKLSITIQSGI